MQQTVQQTVQQALALAAANDGTIKLHLEFTGKIAEQGETIENESMSWSILEIVHRPLRLLIPVLRGEGSTNTQARQ